MEKIEKIKDDLYVKRSMGEWIIVRPIKKDLEKPLTKDNINWKNLLIGSWGTFLTTMFFLAIIIFLILSYRSDMQTCAETLSSPCVQQCQANEFDIPINLSLGVINNERESLEGISS